MAFTCTQASLSDHCACIFVCLFACFSLNQVGDIVMAQVLMANRGMEPELVCVDSYGKKGILGVLRSPTGFLIKVPINLINKLVVFENLFMPGSCKHILCCLVLLRSIYIEQPFFMM